jgi:hypothetical protein
MPVSEDPLSEPLTEELIDYFNDEADQADIFKPTTLPEVLSCRPCGALVLKENRGPHYSWHLWLAEHTWDAEDLHEELD